MNKISLQASQKTKKTLLGELPVEWSVRPLGECAALERGKFAFRPRTDPRFYGGETPFVQTGDVSNARTWIHSYTQTLNEQGLAISKVFPKGTILMAIAANIGDCAILEFDSACPDSVIGISPRDAMDSLFLCYELTEQKQRLHYLAPAGAQKNLNIDFLRNLPISVPPYPEQQKISEILETWDRAIERFENLIAAKRQLKHGLMQQLLTANKGFDGFENQSWRACTLGDVASESILRNNGSLRREKLLAVTKAVGMVPMRERVQGEGVERCKIVRKGWFAYNPMRLNIGSIAKWDGPQEAMVSGDYVVFRCHEDKLDPAFLDHYRRSYRWQRFVETAGIGSVRVRIWFSDLGTMKLRLPCIEEQRRIADVLDACDDEISILAKQLQALRVQKKGLMQKLLTGKVRVTHLLTESA